MSRSSGNWDVWTVHCNTGEKVNLTNHPANDGLPTFSPDGTKIAFVSDREGVWAIWVVNADGSGQQKLFDLGGVMGDDWSTERMSWGP
jgi:TolB protein